MICAGQILTNVLSRCDASGMVFAIHLEFLLNRTRRGFIDVHSLTHRWNEFVRNEWKDRHVFFLASPSARGCDFDYFLFVMCATDRQSTRHKYKLYLTYIIFKRAVKKSIWFHLEFKFKAAHPSIVLFPKCIQAIVHTSHPYPYYMTFLAVWLGHSMC